MYDLSEIEMDPFLSRERSLMRVDLITSLTDYRKAYRLCLHDISRDAI